MSFYATIEGCIRYDTEDDLNNILERLVKGSWMDEDHIWLTEGTHKEYSRPNPTVSFETNTLRIPQKEYRNLSHIEDELLEGADIATMVGSSFDGMFIGWITTETHKEEINLEAWGRARGYEHEYDDESPEAHSAWQREVMNEWHSVHDKYPRF